MWIGIPYTTYGYNLIVPRKIIFCLLASVLYALISLPETNKFIGSYINLTRFDDIESNDRYYLLGIHSIVFGLTMYLLLLVYSPHTLHTTIPKKIMA